MQSFIRDASGGRQARPYDAQASRQAFKALGRQWPPAAAFRMAAREVHVGQGPQACMIDVVTQGEAR